MEKEGKEKEGKERKYTEGRDFLPEWRDMKIYHTHLLHTCSDTNCPHMWFFQSSKFGNVQRKKYVFSAL